MESRVPVPKLLGKHIGVLKVLFDLEPVADWAGCKGKKKRWGQLDLAQPIYQLEKNTQKKTQPK
jgi:hypothetical protein